MQVRGRILIYGMALCVVHSAISASGLEFVTLPQEIIQARLNLVARELADRRTALESLFREAGSADIKDVELSWPIGMPLVRSLGNDLWEAMVLLHGFMKKTQKTPKPDIDLALERKKGTRG